MSTAAPNSEGKPAVCPVNHGKIQQQQQQQEQSAEGQKVCPVRHGKSTTAAAVGGHSVSDEPPDTEDHRISTMLRAAGVRTTDGHNERIEDMEEEGYVPSTSIPSAGLGNSPDGKEWLNPSSGELYRALKRKNKAIPQENADDVAAVHEAVVWMSWKLVMEYEELHKDKCPEPTLARFQGMYGIPTWKSRFMTLVGGRNMIPFDRHDWTVDRCGKEVRYIIDYYSVEEPADPMDGHDAEPSIAYYIDARPAPTPGGIIDRLRIGWRRWRRGESVW